MTNARVDRQRTTQLTSRRFDPARAREVMATLVQEGMAELAAQGYTTGIEVVRGARDALSRPELRARDADRRGRARRRQGRPPLAGLPRGPRGPLRLQHPGRDHRARHLHGHRRLPHPEARAGPPGGGGGHRPSLCHTARSTSSTAATRTRIYDRAALLAGHAIIGPAVVEEAASVTVVNPGQQLHVDPWGHLLIDAAQS